MRANLITLLLTAFSESAGEGRGLRVSPSSGRGEGQRDAWRAGGDTGAPFFEKIILGNIIFAKINLLKGDTGISLINHRLT